MCCPRVLVDLHHASCLMRRLLCFYCCTFLATFAVCCLFLQTIQCDVYIFNGSRVAGSILEARVQNSNVSQGCRCLYITQTRPKKWIFHFSYIPHLAALFSTVHLTAPPVFDVASPEKSKARFDSRFRFKWRRAQREHEAKLANQQPRPHERSVFIG